LCNSARPEQSDDGVGETATEEEVDDSDDSCEMSDASEADDAGSEQLSSKETEEVTEEKKTPSTFHAGISRGNCCLA